ncbi:MAG: hypothetical protein PVH62_06310 [Anaerolineae bacterium]|jgi:hypothetical protein
MTTILEIIERLSFLAAMPAVAGLFIALALLLVMERWQMHALGMAILYFFAALLHTRVIHPEVAAIKLLIGWMIALTLYLTGRRLSEQQEAGEEESSEPTRPPFSMAAGTPLRALILIAVFVIAQASSIRFPLPEVPADVGLACYLLGTGGLFLMGLSEDPFRAGLGLLTFLAGFDLLFGVLEPSLVVAGLLGAAGFLIALGVTFLAVTHAAQEGNQP